MGRASDSGRRVGAAARMGCSSSGLQLECVAGGLQLECRRPLTRHLAVLLRVNRLVRPLHVDVGPRQRAISERRRASATGVRHVAGGTAETAAAVVVVLATAERHEAVLPKVGGQRRQRRERATAAAHAGLRSLGRVDDARLGAVHLGQERAIATLEGPTGTRRVRRAGRAALREASRQGCAPSTWRVLETAHHARAGPAHVVRARALGLSKMVDEVPHLRAIGPPAGGEAVARRRADCFLAVGALEDEASVREALHRRRVHLALAVRGDVGTKVVVDKVEHVSGRGGR
mmetsp:Transcript_641/g.1945  ORF Transcript_641/g.1945 Transcript_641/m.1945 type:complete len:289 (-) Transcript_641:96-962(-)